MPSSTNTRWGEETQFTSMSSQPSKLQKEEGRASTPTPCKPLRRIQTGHFPQQSLPSLLKLSMSLTGLLRSLLHGLHVPKIMEVKDLDVVPYVYEAIDQLQQRKVAWTEHRTLDFLSSSPPVRQRIVSQPKAGFHKSLEDSLVQSLKSTDRDGVGVPELAPMDVNLVKDALSKRQPVGSKGTDVAVQTETAIAKLKEEAGWVYESAFADKAFASDNPGKGIDLEIEKAAPDLDEYVAVEKEGDVGGASDWEELVMESPETKDPMALVVDADKN